MMLVKRLRVVSSGGPGCDMAALEAAWETGLATGGWTSKEIIESRPELNERFNLFAVDEPDAEDAWNIRDTDATVLVAHNRRTPRMLAAYNKIDTNCKRFLFVPYYPDEHFNFDDAQKVADFVLFNGYMVLNVIGNSEREAPGIGDWARRLFKEACLQYKHRSPPPF